jgi:hypothetical protein
MSLLNGHRKSITKQFAIFSESYGGSAERRVRALVVNKVTSEHSARSVSSTTIDRLKNRFASSFTHYYLVN